MPEVTIAGPDDGNFVAAHGVSSLAVSFRASEERVVSASLPVMILTVLGALIAVLGLFAAGDIRVTIIGLVAVAFAGVLQVAGGRRQS